MAGSDPRPVRPTTSVHAVTLFQRYPVPEPDGGEFRFSEGHPRTPLMYSIRASKAV